MMEYLYASVAGLFLAATILLLQPSAAPAQASQEALGATIAAGGDIEPVGVLRSAPSLSAAQIDAILASYGSPAHGSGQDFYDLGVEYGIDPAYALAFFVEESSAGTDPRWDGLKPDGSTTHDIGNISCGGGFACYGRWRDYASWHDGIEDWYRLIDVEYIQQRGHQTVDDVIPVYAPAFENDVGGYTNTVSALVGQWREQYAPASTACPVNPCWLSGHGYSSGHPGIDLGASLGQPVYATMDGTAHTSTTWPCGNGVSVTNGNMMTRMCHLSAFSVADGQAVRAGDQVGEAGQSGEAYGVHVHFEIRQNGSNLDPTYVLGQEH